MTRRDRPTRNRHSKPPEHRRHTMSQRPDAESAAPLAPTLVEAIAQRVAELLRAELHLAPRLLTPNEVAERFAVSRTWVYEHATELGAVRLGDGPKARLRFDPDRVRQVLSRQPEEDTARPTRAARGRMRKGLLPIGGE
jgi:hypothetical protein